MNLRYTQMFPKSLSTLKQENLVVDLVSNSAMSLQAALTEETYPKFSAIFLSNTSSQLKIPAMFFLFVSREWWDLDVRLFVNIIRTISENLRLRLLSFSKFNLSPSRSMWFWWVEYNADQGELAFSHRHTIRSVRGIVISHATSDPIHLLYFVGLILVIGRNAS